MSIDLELRAARTGTTHEGFKVHVRLRNRGSEPVEAPNLFDTSAALNFELFLVTARKLRNMNGMTGQAMLVGARPDGRQMIEELAAGEAWERTIDLAPFHYPLPAGNLVLRATYEYEPAQLRLFSELIRVVVTNPALESIRFQYENCMLDSLTAILHTVRAGKPGWILRQYNYGSPLAAWYSEPILENEPAETAMCSTAAFAWAETFDPMFERWVVWTVGDRVKARRHVSGKASGEVRQAEIPAGCRLLPWCNHERGGGLLLYFEADGRFECRRMEADGLPLAFGCATAGKVSAAGADEESVHLLMEQRGLAYQRLSFTGETLAETRLFRSRLPLHSCRIEPLTGRIKALFRERPRGGSLEAFGASLRSGETSHTAIDRLPLHRPLTELSFDVDGLGRLHLLAATDEGKLYYLGPQRGAALVASGEDRYFPEIVAPRSVYLGYFDSRLGYRFSQFKRGRRGSKLVPFEEPL
ncbi:MAG TPA: hypothetical protein VG456_21130 [Candidatus Sulfopaludibacter sp.]|jgi:hypothetical protein|nr:hypothetical protein [Candidatus Sulfopaludibacter sp.]